MTDRKLARIVQIDAIAPIPNADRIECAHVGGWRVVVPRNEFRPGDMAVYFEIDSFLPDGEPAWQFLVDKQARVLGDVRGHALRTVTLQGQISQGLLLSIASIPRIARWIAGFDSPARAIGQNVTDLTGIAKWVAPIPAELSGLARGMFPTAVPKTDQERIQNLSAELAAWRSSTAPIVWELTEKIEGASCTWAWLDGELHVCTRGVDLLETPNNSLWRLARELDIEAKLRRIAGTRQIALQGEVYGNGIEGNVYRLRTQAFALYHVWDVNEGRYWAPSERQRLAHTMGIANVPVISNAFVLPPDATVESLLALAEAPSALLATQHREGLVFKATDSNESFKVISNAYLRGLKVGNHKRLDSGPKP